MWCMITKVEVLNYRPDTNDVLINGTMEIQLSVIDELGPGKNEQALVFHLTNAKVIGTVFEGPLTSKHTAHMMILVKEIIPGPLYSSDSTFGPVNDLLIQ